MSPGNSNIRSLDRSVSHILSVFIFVSVILNQVLPAQEQPDNSSTVKYLGLQFYAGIDSYREDLIIPLGFDGPGLSLGGHYTWMKEDNIIDLRLKLGMGYLTNRFSHEAWALLMELRPVWLKKVANYQEYGELWAGMSLPLQMNNLFFDSWDESHLYWLTAYSLAIAAQWQKKVFEKYDATARIEIPMFGWVSRPPNYRYNKQDALNHVGFHFSEPNKNLHFETMDTYRSLFIQLLFKRSLKSSLLNLGIEFQYNYCRRPQKIQGITTSILFSYQWRIGS